MEALYAEKALDEEEVEAAAAEAEAPAARAVEAQADAPEEAEPEVEAEEPKKEDVKPAASPGGMFGNLFAEKLKSALTKKRQEDVQKKKE
jgi:nucleoid-associated protein YgaU